MEFKLNTNKFTATEKLVAYVEKKVEKLKKHEGVQRAELTLEVVKPNRQEQRSATQCRGCGSHNPCRKNSRHF